METVKATVLRGGWWLPGRAITPGEVLDLDPATAEGLALRGIVRIERPEPVLPADEAKPTTRKRASKEG
jgi:hypothetical protein